MANKFDLLIRRILEVVDALPPTPPAIVQQAPLKNVDIVAAALIGEAGGEGKTGMQAVMNVIMNRSARSSDFVRGIISTILKPKQFSFFNNYTSGKESMENIVARARMHPRWNEAMEVALAGLSKKLPDITQGATHYHVTSGPGKVAPSWSSPTVGGKNTSAIVTNTIGRHTFLKNIR